MATLPPILVELKANSSELQAKLGEVQNEFKKTSDSSQSMASKIKDHFGTISTAVGGALAGAGTALAALGSKDQAAHQQLQQAIENTGKSYEDYKDRIESTIKSQEKFGNDASSTQDAIRILTQGTGDAGKAMDLMGNAADLAAARHESLSQAATDLVKIYSGTGTRVLNEFGISTKDLTKAQSELSTATKASQSADDNLSKAKQKLADLQAIQSSKTKLTVADQIALRNAEQAVTDDTQKAADAHKKLADAQQAVTDASKGGKDAIAQLSDKLQGQAAAASDTFMGHINALKTHVEDVAASLGQRFGPALTVGGGILAGVGQGINGVSAILGKFKTAQEASTVATEGLTTATEAGTVATDAATASEGLALAPILLIIGAIALLGAGIYELVTHWSTVWGAVKGAITDAWNWIRARIDDIAGFVTGLPARIVAATRGLWDSIKNGATDVKNWIGDRVDDIVSFFAGLPGRIVDAARNLFHGIVDEAKKLPGQIASAIPGGGVVSSLLDHLPHFAAGGPIGAGMLSVVGENGPELFVPGSSGTIVPNAAAFGGGGSSVSVGQIVVNAAPGMDVDALARAVQSKLLQAGRGQVRVGLS